MGMGIENGGGSNYYRTFGLNQRNKNMVKVSENKTSHVDTSKKNTNTQSVRLDTGNKTLNINSDTGNKTLNINPAPTKNWLAQLMSNLFS